MIFNRTTSFQMSRKNLLRRSKTVVEPEKMDEDEMFIPKSQLESMALQELPVYVAASQLEPDDISEHPDFAGDATSTPRKERKWRCIHKGNGRDSSSSESSTSSKSSAKHCNCPGLITEMSSELFVHFLSSMQGFLNSIPLDDLSDRFWDVTFDVHLFVKAILAAMLCENKYMSTEVKPEMEMVPRRFASADMSFSDLVKTSIRSGKHVAWEGCIARWLFQCTRFLKNLKDTCELNRFTSKQIDIMLETLLHRVATVRTWNVWDAPIAEYPDSPDSPDSTDGVFGKFVKKNADGSYVEAELHIGSSVNSIPLPPESKPAAEGIDR